MPDKLDLPQEFPEINSPQDIWARPNYRANIDPSKVHLTGIVGPYTFPEKVQCGLADCHQHHNSGWLVETDAGIETNIGWICGQAAFGVAFTHKKRQYREAERVYRSRRTLRGLLAQANTITEQLRALQQQEHGGRWLTTSLQAFKRLYPAWLVEALRHRAVKGEYAVHRDRPRSKEELEIARAASPGTPEERLRYIQEQSGVLVGLSIFSKPVSDWSAYGLPKKLTELKEIDLERLGVRQLSAWAKWAGEVDTALRDFQALVEDGRKFFRGENLALLIDLANRPEDRQQVSRLKWDYESGSGSDSRNADRRKHRELT